MVQSNDFRIKGGIGLNKGYLFGSILPEGWLKENLEKNMEGCIGHLDELLPELLKDDKIYGENRLTHKKKDIRLGRNELVNYEELGQLKDRNMDIQFYWWNSESQSNWMDGYCRTALLLQDPVYLKKLDLYIEEILGTQDEDGYLGIYGEDLRYCHTMENGELWAKSTLYRVLLGYFEATGNENVWEALIKSVDELMSSWPLGKCDPFQVEKSFSGHAHGLTVIDTLDRITELTSDQKYSDYAAWLYERFCENDIFENDLQYDNIMDVDFVLKGHGVHVYEHIRALAVASMKSEKYKAAMHVFLTKLKYHITPSGGPAGDEWIRSRTADATYTGYEFCSVHELLDSYSFLLKKSGDLAWADRIEWLYYNAAFGMKHPNESTILYCKTDNCYEILQRKNPGDSMKDQRYKYSPTHQETAVCCVPNFGRISPYFVNSMYLPADDGVKVALYGPSVYHGEWEGDAFSIRQETAYPFGRMIRLCLESPQKLKLAIYLRFPAWANKMKIDGKVFEKPAHNKEIKLMQEFEGKEVIEIEFDYEVAAKQDLKDDIYFTAGPLLFALPIEGAEGVCKELGGGFTEKEICPIDRSHEHLLVRKCDFSSFKLEESDKEGWEKFSICAHLFDGYEERAFRMIPFGHTSLRKTTFQLFIEN